MPFLPVGVLCSHISFHSRVIHRSSINLSVHNLIIPFEHLLIYGGVIVTDNRGGAELRDSLIYRSPKSRGIVGDPLNDLATFRSMK